MGASHRSGAVLVVEDDFLIAIDSKAVLAELGFHDVYIAHMLLAKVAAFIVCAVACISIVIARSDR